MLNRARAFWLVSILAVSAASVFGVGCGDDDDGGSGGGGSTPGEDGYTLDNVCAKLPVATCEERKECCEKGSGFDQAGCEARERTECEANVAEVKAGTMTFHPENIAPCFAMLEPYGEQCFLTLSDLYTFLEEFKICHIFTDQRALGETCERRSQCATSEVEDEAIGCNEGTCSVVRFLAEGAACSVTSQDSFCTGGLYCDADAETMEGTCEKAAAVGDDCSSNPLVCGLDSYCDPTAGLCTAPKAGGDACTSHIECQSFVCDAATSQCNPIRILSSELECKGDPAP